MAQLADIAEEPAEIEHQASQEQRIQFTQPQNNNQPNRDTGQQQACCGPADSASASGGARPPAYQNIPGVVPTFQGRANNPPPSYDDVINPNAPPPAYQALFGYKRPESGASKRQPTSFLEWLMLGLIGLAIAVFTLSIIVLPFVMILVGLFFYADCNLEHIPFFLIVGGLIWASKNGFHCYDQRSNFRQELHCPAPLARIAPGSVQLGPEVAANQINNYKPLSFICNAMLRCLLTSWYVAFFIVVLRSRPDFENPASVNYCNQTIYTFSLHLVSLTMLICVIYLCSICLIRMSPLVEAALSRTLAGGGPEEASGRAQSNLIAPA